MPEARPVPITPPPGVVKTEADRVVEGRWIDSQWARFQNGRPQKRGGHTRQTDDEMIGVPRALAAWRDLAQQNYLAGGTSKKLYVYDASFGQHDITPLEASGTLGNNPFATTDESSIVVVTHTSHTRRPGSTVIFDGATAVGGLTLDGPYTVLVVTGANTYTIDAGSDANATTSGGGASVTYEYEVNSGAEAGTYALGYGTGGYGLSSYGTLRSLSNLLIEARVWTLQNYGALLFAAYNGGTIFTFDPAHLSTNGRAEPLAGAPTDVRAMFITEERYVFALRDNMVVSWPDQVDPTDWNPDEDDTANSRRLTDGTKLIGGLSLGQGISLVWSDNALYLFQYVGSGTIYNSRKAATNCGLIAPHAKAADASGIVYWMSSHSFHLYNGAVQEIPNVDDIKTFVFDELRADQPYLCWAYYDPKFHEVTFFYVPLGTFEPTLSVTYHIDDQCWTPNDWSAFKRASGARFQHGDTRPYLGGVDGHLYLHEDGKNADDAAILSRIKLAPVAIADGVANLEVDGVRIDIKDQSGDLILTMMAYDTLRGGPIDSAEKVVTIDDELIDLRLAGRYVDLELVSNEIDGDFRFGKPVALVKGGGSRR